MADQADILAENKALREMVSDLRVRLTEQTRELAQARKIRDDFAALAAHDLRTPITVIKESLAQLSDRLFGEVNDQQDQLLQLALQNVDRLTNGINHFLDEASRAREQSR